MNFGSVKKMVRSAIPARVASMVRRRPKKFEAVVHRAAPNTWVAEKLPECVPKVQSLLPLFKKIEAQAEKTDSAGALPLWEGYHALEDFRKTCLHQRSDHRIRCGRRVGLGNSILGWSRHSNQSKSSKSAALLAYQACTGVQDWLRMAGEISPVLSLTPTGRPSRGPIYNQFWIAPGWLKGHLRKT